jgi:hypothetical protein
MKWSELDCRLPFADSRFMSRAAAPVFNRQSAIGNRQWKGFDA